MPFRYLQNFLILKERAEKVLAGKISSSEFLSTLERMDAILARAQEQYNAVEIEEELTPEALRGIDVLGDGLSEYRCALKVMAGFFSDGDPSHIQLGIEQAFIANEKLIKVLHMADQEGKPSSGESQGNTVM
ncbi:MAG: hypothetical protein HYU64_06800 [Armatimonadetes bacterium]|nr:hypothetical protein [Armatimonadota bacterium]